MYSIVLDQRSADGVLRSTTVLLEEDAPTWSSLGDLEEPVDVPSCRLLTKALKCRGVRDHRLIADGNPFAREPPQIIAQRRMMSVSNRHFHHPFGSLNALRP